MTNDNNDNGINNTIVTLLVIIITMIIIVSRTMTMMMTIPITITMTMRMIMTMLMINERYYRAVKGIQVLGFVITYFRAYIFIVILTFINFTPLRGISSQTFNIILMYILLLSEPFLGEKGICNMCSSYINVQPRLDDTISKVHTVCGPLSLEVIDIMLLLAISEICDLIDR